MVMAGELLQKLTPLPMDIPSAASYLKHLTKGKWKAFRMDNSPEAGSPTARFLILDRQKQRKSAHEIGRPQYVNLLLVAFRPYMQVFPLKTYFQGLKLSPGASPNTKTSCPTDRSPLNHHNWEALERDLSLQVQQLAANSGKQMVRRQSNKSAGGDSPPLVLEEINVTPSLLVHYHDEVKHLLLIQRWLRTKAGDSEEERELFAPWRRYLAMIDETLGL